jgi:photosystem II stability/assembly factor-like uncharacterized protein
VNLRGIFFRNTSEGWTVVSYPEKNSVPSLEALRNQKTLYSIAHTVDGGDSWSFRPLTYPELPQWIQDTFAGPADLYFLDSLHGWMDIAFEGNARPGKLLATQDGGNTWEWVNSPGVSGSISFPSPQDGWLVSNWGADQLYVTHDGCKTWQEVSLSPPPQVGAAIYPTFQAPPVFQDPLRGFLVVHYSGGPETPTKLVVYSTIDGGKNWQPAKVLAEAGEHSRAAGFPFAIVDSVIIVSTGSSASDVTVASVALLDGRSSAVRLSDRGVVTLTFSDSNNGWVQSADSRLLGTDNGGLSWKDIGPRRGLNPRRGTTIKVAPSTSFSSSPQPFASGSFGGSAHLSRHLGFDMSYVRPSSDMATWWKYSPYYDTFIYLPGSKNRGHDANLISPWVTQVEIQGWGVIPIWFGLQSACVIGATNIKSFFGTTTGVTVASEAKSEADSAASAASSLGLSNTVIYKDIELYDTTNSSCASAVVAYVGAWVSELHSLGYSAGVYANNGPAQQNVSLASPLPDEIWVAKVDGRATIWGLGALNDSLWPTNQRSHQYVNYSTIGSGETYGGVTFACPSCIDRDINDLPAAGTNGVKTYSSWTLTPVDYPSNPPNTALFGVNDRYMGQLDSSGNYMPPVLTGIYCVNCMFGSVNVGFSLDTGVFTSLNSYVNGEAKPFGVNNTGKVVGHFYPTGPEQGFVFDSNTASASFLNAPGASVTLPKGVNDDSQIAGSWADSSGNLHGFFLDSLGTWTTIDPSGTKSTNIVGLNGIGQVAGYTVDAKSNTHGFVYSKVDGWTNIDCKGSPSTVLTGISNNGQVAGYCSGTLGTTSVFLYDLAHGTMSQVVTNNTNDQAWGVNDNNIVVGFCSLTPCSTGGMDGYYATPNP